MIELSELRKVWAERRANAESMRARIDPNGATRPARDPDEAALLKSAGQESPFVEVDRPGWLEWLEYRDTPAEQRNPPGLTAADFARPFLEAERAREAAEKKSAG
jgi:hypothetical protein